MKRPDELYGKGWVWIVEPVFALAERWGIKVTESTTEFGILRLRWEPPGPGRDLEPGQYEQFRKIAMSAEALSGVICDQCGLPGRMCDTFPVTTRCSLHAKGKFI